MSDETRNQANRNNAGRPAGPEAVSVKELRFCVKDGRDLPLADIGINGGKDILQAGDRAGGLTVVIEWKPWLRHHHVRVLDGKTLKSECMVHESWATWVPMPVAIEAP